MMMHNCPVCDSRECEEVFCASRQPAMLNRLHATRREALSARAVEMHFCMCDGDGRCGFVWNAAFNPESVKYAPGYINDQSQSPAFRSHLDQVRDRLASLIHDHAGDVLEIGCGQGDFLRSLCAATARDGIGFDPAYAGGDEANGKAKMNGRLQHAVAARASESQSVRMHASLFDASAARAHSSVYSAIVCRHVLEHLPNPAMVVRECASLLTASGILYVEVPCFEWIARNGAFFDLFNEHCSLFSPRSLERMLRDAGFAGIRIERVFGGQYLAAEASFNRADISSSCDDFNNIMAPHVRNTLEEARQSFAATLLPQIDARPCMIWGAGAKGVSIVNHLGIDDSALSCLIDIHPLKQGRFSPITGQQVIAPHEIARFTIHDSPPLIFIMNPNYAAEIIEQLEAGGIDADVRVLDGRPRVALHC